MAEVPTPEAGPGQVIVRLAYASVNPADWKCREGWLAQFFPFKFPFIVGFDGAGVVSAVGPGVKSVKAGDRVGTMSNQGEGDWGTYAEFARCNEDTVVKLAPSVPFRDAACVPVAAITSWEGIDNIAHVKAGQTVLVHGGAGGCGSFAIQFAKRLGARVAATCGPANLDYVKSLGAERAINYREENIAEAVNAWSPGGVDFALDCVGQGTLKDGLKCVKRGGILGFIATLIKDEPLFNPEEGAKAGVSVQLVMGNRERNRGQYAKIMELLNKGEIKVPHLEEMPLAQAGAAQEKVKAGHVRGKIVLKIADL
jgi:NADPH:quinone reductase-like Zn-dependent oxidoreductase